MFFEKIKKKIGRIFPSTGSTTDPSYADIWDLLQGGGAGGGGGYSYRPQTAEEAAALQAQAEREKAAARLYGAQATDIPLARELARRMGLAEIGVQQAERAANPRRIFEALYTQARLKPTEMAKSLQEKMNIPGFEHGGKTVAGPTLARVGKHDDEYALLPPGAVVAPKPEGEKATVGNAVSAILQQMREGGVVSQTKAKKMLKHGEVRDRPLTEAQRGLFGLIAGGGTPTRLRKAQAGIVASGASTAQMEEIRRRMGRGGGQSGRYLGQPSGGGSIPGTPGSSSAWGEEFGLPSDVSEEMERLRQQATTTVLGATRKATAGTSLFDPMGGGLFTPEQTSFLGGLNLRQFRKLSPTQQKALFSTLSAGRVEPEDYVESLQRQFAGFNPVQAGTRARFSGILGR